VNLFAISVFVTKDVRRLVSGRMAVTEALAPIIASDRLGLRSWAFALSLTTSYSNGTSAGHIRQMLICNFLELAADYPIASGITDRFY
jgi:hypothetical protein